MCGKKGNVRGIWGRLEVRERKRKGGGNKKMEGHVGAVHVAVTLKRATYSQRIQPAKCSV